MKVLSLLLRHGSLWWVGAALFIFTAMGFSRSGNPVQAASPQAANTGQAVLVCKFETIQPATAASGGTLPGLGQPQVIYTAAQPVYLSEFTPDGRLLTLQDIPGNLQQVGLLAIPGGQFTPLAERRYSGSLPRWDATRGAPIYLDWQYSDSQTYLATYTLRSPSQVLVQNASLSFDITPSGEALYFGSNPEQPGGAALLTTGTPPLPNLIPRLPILQEPASVVTNAHPAYQGWPSQPFQIALRPGTGQMLLFNQPKTLLADPGGSCALDLGSQPAENGPAPLWAVQARWSLDGRYLAVIATSTLPGQPAGLGAALQSTSLLVFDFTRQTRMEFPLVPEVHGTRYVTDMAWSPDGQNLAVLGLVGISPEGYEQLGLFLVDPEAGTSAHAAQAGMLGGGLWGTQLAWGKAGLAATCPLPGVGRVCLLENLPPNLYPPASLPDQPHQLPETSRSASAPDFVVPTDLFIEVYPLTSNGNRREDAGLCTPQSTQWGCTAFCNETGMGCAAPTSRVVPYPYNQNPLDIPFEEDYLLDVVPQEMGDWYDTGALYAQAVAARTYAFYFAANPPTTLAYNNSISFQAFIPLKFEAIRYFLYPNNFEIWDNACTGDYGDLNPGQKKICDATANVTYLAYNGASPIVAMFAADAYARTIDNGTTPYLRGVPDPISTACDARDLGHYRGMSQYGAGRWIRAHECSYSGASIYGDNPPGEPWPVRFSPAHTLTHYYTSVHLYNEFQERLTPNLRWLLLDASWGAAGGSMLTLFREVPYRAVLQIQNSGTASWPARSGEGQVALLQRWVTTHNVFYHIVPLPGPLEPGQTLFFEIDFPTKFLPPGDYEVTFDMGLLTSGGWQHFGDQPALDYDGFEYLMPAIILDAPYRSFLPLVGR